jgi:hypothetical protein
MTEEVALDAYGHMEWTVGNEDWIACFDAIRTADGIAYHVVVDCESGGWIDTLDSGTIAVDDANALENLTCLPEYWAGVCWEHYYDQPAEMHPNNDDVADCARRWREHLIGLAAEPTPEPDEEPSDESAELRKAALNHRGEP